MATSTLLKKIVSGNECLSLYEVDAQATASFAVATNVGILEAASIHPLSCASVGFGIICKTNKAADGTALNGSVFVSSTTSGDKFYLVCYGKA